MARVLVGGPLAGSGAAFEQRRWHFTHEWNDDLGRALERIDEGGSGVHGQTR